MYRGFNLELNEGDLKSISCSYGKSPGIQKLGDLLPDHIKYQKTLQKKALNDQAKEIMDRKRKYDAYKDRLHKDLDNYINSEGNIDVSAILADWFPSVNAHVFISHSHKDKKLASGLADWLEEKFNIDSFIDSYLWGYVEYLLKEIDEKYSKNDDNDSYEYKMRNYTTSNVYMMLATSLVKMIDKTECIIFLTTKNSVPSNENNPQTHSIWLYYETLMTNLIRQTQPIRPGMIKEGAELIKSKQKPFPNFSYDISLKHLSPLNRDILQKWCNSGRKSPESALDWLYENVAQKPSRMTWLLD